MPALLAIMLCAGTGWCVVRLGWRLQSMDDLLLKAALTLPCGLAVFSLEYFLWRMFSSSRATLIGIDLTVLLVLLALGLKLQPQARRPRSSFTTPIFQPCPLAAVLWSIFVTAIGIATYCCIRWAKAEPHGGGWDAFAIWNLHARFLFLGGAHWRDGFSGLIPWSHPDYPLLVPASIAHFWTYLQADPEFVPAAVGIVFTFSTVLLLYAATRMLRGSSQALIAGIVLLGTPYFLRQGVSQYADIPLCFFILATIVLSEMNSAEARPGWVALSGFTAACASWTKNEGFLFFCAFVVLQAARVVKERRWQE